MAELTSEQRRALDIARALAEFGIPVFVAPDGWPEEKPSGAMKGWQQTKPNPRYVDAWRPGKRLCAVMGRGLDLVDLDPRNGGDATKLEGAMPFTYAVAATPSEGWHGFVKSMGVRSHDGVLLGIDVKAGVNGDGHGFAFIEPTVRASKVTGELVPYRWVVEPDLEGLKAAADDRSGEKLAEMVRQARRSDPSSDDNGEARPSPWDDVPGLLATTGRHDAVYKLACALRGRGGWRAGDALEYMRAVVWPEVCKVIKDHPYTEAEFEADVRDAFTRHPDGPTAGDGPPVIREPFQGVAATLLDRVHEFLRAYAAFPSEAASVAVTLWAAHTHLVGAFESTPRLALLSPEKQCGKTRVLELLELLCPGAERLSDASPAYMFRRIGAGSVTIELDEVDAIWKRGKGDEAAEALRSIVNAGHRKGGFVGRVEMNGKAGELKRFTVYAPVALAGIGDCLPDTVLDRSIIVAMRRRAPSEKVQEYRERTTRPEGEALRDLLDGWADTVADKVGCPWPEMPPGVTDRPADVWEPLLMVADLAGGEWPDKARNACVEFVTGAQADDASLGVRLLGDLLDAFRDGNEIAPAMSTESVLRKLHGMAESPWADWYGKPFSARNLAKMLKPYGVNSKVVRIGDETPRGYARESLWDAWTRYGVLSATSATSATPLARHVADVADVADTQGKPNRGDHATDSQYDAAVDQQALIAGACLDPTHSPKWHGGNRWTCPECEEAAS